MASVAYAQRKVTYRDLQSWPDDGRRYELYGGEVVEVPAPFPRHQIAMLELTDRLRAYIERHGGIVLTSPIDIVFDEENVLQPDIVVFTAARKHHVPLDEAIRVAPDVAVEVLSSATAARDRSRKLRMFERFGVREYWIVDPVDPLIEVRELRDGAYVLAATAGRGEHVKSSVLGGFTCAVDALFPWTQSA
jgi:Uma2 family endonuclease